VVDMPAKQTEGGITIVLKDNATKEINKIQRKARNHGFYMDPIFDEMKNNLERAMTSFSLQIGEETKNMLKDRVPFDNSPTRDFDRKHGQHKKHLRDNIQKKMYNKGKYTVEIFVGWEREYKKIAQLVNDGASGHMIYSKGKALAIPIPTSPKGSRGSDGFIFIRDGVFHPGFEGRHFIDMTYQEISLIVEQRFENCLNAASAFSTR
jgi:hypothetical protein